MTPDPGKAPIARVVVIGVTGRMGQALLRAAPGFLKPGGFLVVELGYDSAEHVSRLLDSPEWTGVAITNDLAGIPRVACASRAFK